MIKTSSKKQMAQTLGKGLVGVLLMGAFGLAMAQAAGGLPQVKLPAEATAGGWITTAKYVIGATLLILSLALGGGAFMVGGSAVLRAFNDVTSKKATVGDVAVTIVMAAVVVVVVVGFAIAGASIIPTTV
jgi:hypothetical protein